MRIIGLVREGGRKKVMVFELINIAIGLVIMGEPKKGKNWYRKKVTRQNGKVDIYDVYRKQFSYEGKKYRLDCRGGEVEFLARKEQIIKEVDLLKTKKTGKSLAEYIDWDDVPASAETLVEEMNITRNEILKEHESVEKTDRGGISRLISRIHR